MRSPACQTTNLKSSALAQPKRWQKLKAGISTTKLGITFPTSCLQFRLPFSLAFTCSIKWLLIKIESEINWLIPQSPSPAEEKEHLGLGEYGNERGDGRAQDRRNQVRPEKGKQIPRELSPGKWRQQAQRQRPIPLSFSLHQSPFPYWNFSPLQIVNSYLKPQFTFLLYKTFPNPSTPQKNRSILWTWKVFHFAHLTIMLTLFCNISRPCFVTSCNYYTIIWLFTYLYLKS